LSIICCGIKYSKNDIETYWCIDTDINKPVQKKYVGNNKVVKEVVESYTCKKCGSFVLRILRYSNFKNKKRLVEQERLSGIDAVKYLEATRNVRQRQPQYFPYDKEIYCKTIPFVYGKFIDSETQRARYLNEAGWASEEKILTKIVYTKT